MKTQVLLMTLAMTGLLSWSAHAESLADVKARMDGRLPKVTELKVAKAVGENNAGMLQALKADLADADKGVVQAENSDRLTVYDTIAKKTPGATVETVGRQRAEQIAAKSDAGIMLQKPDGTWHEKGK